MMIKLAAAAVLFGVKFVPENTLNKNPKNLST